jgi:integrase
MRVQAEETRAFLVAQLQAKQVVRVGGFCRANVIPESSRSFSRRRAQGLTLQTINHRRRFVLTAYNRAKKAGRWLVANLAEDVEARRVPSRAQYLLHGAEVRPLLRALEPRWQPLFAVAIYTGLRRGELLGLRKKDVDLANGLLTVARSYGRDTTKGGHADTIPVPSKALPWLAEAIELARASWSSRTSARPPAPTKNAALAQAG